MVFSIRKKPLSQSKEQGRCPRCVSIVSRAGGEIKRKAGKCQSFSESSRSTRCGGAGFFAVRILRKHKKFTKMSKKMLAPVRADEVS
jgi:hypothetical protein